MKYSSISSISYFYYKPYYQDIRNNVIPSESYIFVLNIYNSIITFVLLKRTFKRFINHFYWLIRYACSSYNKSLGIFVVLTIADEEEEKSKKARSESWQCEFWPCERPPPLHHIKNYFSLFSSNCLNERTKTSRLVCFANQELSKRVDVPTTTKIFFH